MGTGARWALVPGGRYDHVGDPLIQVIIKGRTQASVPLEFSDFRYAAARVSLGLNNMRGNPSPLWVEAHV